MTFDAETVRQVLNLEWPLQIVRGVADDRLPAGSYEYRDNRHLIWVNPDADVDQANFIVWHEATHAMQHERCHRAGLDYMVEYKKQMEAVGIETDEPINVGPGMDEGLRALYNSVPQEMEANYRAHKLSSIGVVFE